MRYLKYAALLGVLLFAAGRANAQVRIGVAAIGAGRVAVGVDAAPACAYGYYGSYPYACAPYGYYGPQYFVNGAFIGADPWYHAPRYYYGHPYGGRLHGPPVYAQRRYNRGPVVHGYIHESYRRGVHDRR